MVCDKSCCAGANGIRYANGFELALPLGISRGNKVIIIIICVQELVSLVWSIFEERLPLFDEILTLVLPAEFL